MPISIKETIIKANVINQETEEDKEVANDTAVDVQEIKDFIKSEISRNEREREER